MFQKFKEGQCESGKVRNEKKRMIKCKISRVDRDQIMQNSTNCDKMIRFYSKCKGEMLENTKQGDKHDLLCVFKTIPMTVG